MSQIIVDVDQIVAELNRRAQQQHETGKAPYVAATDTVETYFEASGHGIVEQMFIIETLLATRGLDVGTYRAHILEDTGHRTASETVITQLCENALRAAILRETFDESPQEIERRQTRPPRIINRDPASVVADLETEAARRYETDQGGRAAAVHDTLDTNWSSLGGASLTEQAAIIDHVVRATRIEDPTPSEQLRDSARESTSLIVGSLLWHTLAACLQHRLETETSGGSASESDTSEEDDRL